jgi:hypothetical protein
MIGIEYERPLASEQWKVEESGKPGEGAPMNPMTIREIGDDVPSQVHQMTDSGDGDRAPKGTVRRANDGVIVQNPKKWEMGGDGEEEIVRPREKWFQRSTGGEGSVPSQDRHQRGKMRGRCTDRHHKLKD